MILPKSSIKFAFINIAPFAKHTNGEAVQSFCHERRDKRVVTPFYIIRRLAISLPGNIHLDAYGRATPTPTRLMADIH